MFSRKPLLERSEKDHWDRRLSEALCYDLSAKRCGELLSGLAEYRMLVCALTESLQALESGELEKFDSLVGENACQIRAVCIARIYSQRSIDISVHLDKCRCILKEIEKLLIPSTIGRLMTSRQSLQEVFDEHNLDIRLPCAALFVLKSFLLTEMGDKPSTGVEHFMPSLYTRRKCNPSKIRRIDSEISSSFTHRLASHLRQSLASASVRYVRDLAQELQDPHLIRMVSDDFTTTHNALQCIPMFWTYKILLKSAQQNKLPLLVRIRFIEDHEKGEGYRVREKEKVLFFRPTDASGGLDNAYILDVPQEHDLEKAACVIQGVARADSSWDASLLEQSITDAILAGAADHRQYPDPGCIVPIDDPEYTRFKLAAGTRGFSSENPSTFFIQHVYPSQVKNHSL